MASYSETQMREIFHFLFLEQLLKISDPKIYVVKGGVNLRFFFHSPRYSEDMDIDVLAGNVATLKKNGYKILETPAFRRTLQTYSITSIEINDPAKAKHTETTQRFRVRLLTEAGDSLPTKVEFSRREIGKDTYVQEKIDPGVAKPYQKLSFECQHYSGETAVVQKIRALAGREITQARDLFDLGILNSGGYLQNKQIIKLVTKDTLKEARENLSRLSYSDFEGQVLEFLESDVRAQYKGKGVWEKLKDTIDKGISDAG